MKLFDDIKLRLDLDDFKTGIEQAKSIVDTLRPYIREMVKQEVQAAIDEAKFSARAATTRKLKSVPVDTEEKKS